MSNKKEKTYRPFKIGKPYAFRNNLPNVATYIKLHVGDKFVAVGYYGLGLPVSVYENESQIEVDRILLTWISNGNMFKTFVAKFIY